MMLDDTGAQGNIPFVVFHFSFVMGRGGFKLGSATGI